MFAGMPSLSHQQQQEAAERIHDLMEQGMSSGEAIAIVAQEIREAHKDDRVTHMFDDEPDQPTVSDYLEEDDDTGEEHDDD